MLRKLLIVVVLIVGIIVLVSAWGGSLPADHRAGVSAHLAQPPEAVFATLTDFMGSLLWRSDLSGIERGPRRDGKDVWIEQSSHGPLLVEVTESDPPSHLVLTIPPEADLPFDGTWTFQLASEGDGTRLTLVEEGRVHNPLFRAIGKLFRDPYATMTTYVTDLGAHFKERLDVEHVPEG